MGANWDYLHLRLASGARDKVIAADLDGKDLTVTDRDALLNYAVRRLLTSVFRIYNNQQAEVGSIVSDFIGTAHVDASSAGLISSASLPTDFGILLGISKDGIPINVESPEDFERKADYTNLEVYPSIYSMAALQKSDGIHLLPSSSVGSFSISYFKDFAEREQGTSPDFALDNQYFETIASFALFRYWMDKTESELAKTHLMEAYSSCPFPLTEKADKEE